MNNSGGEFFGALLMLAAGAFVVYVGLIIAIYTIAFLSILAGFIAFAWTIVCLIAWFFPFQLGPIYLDSESARAFIIRGVFGAIVLPSFLLFAELVLDVKISWQYLHFYMVAGYTLLSVGLGYLFAQHADIPHVHYEFNQPRYEVLPPPPQQRQLPAPRQQPPYASWDDEEEFR